MRELIIHSKEQRLMSPRKLALENKHQNEPPDAQRNDSEVDESDEELDDSYADSISTFNGVEA